MTTDKRELALYWPDAMLQEIQTQATRTDRSLSSIVQAAWKHSAAHIAAGDRETLNVALEEYAGSANTKRKQTLYYPAEMITEFQAQAARLDSSVSYIVQVAFALAKAHIATLPDVAAQPES